MLKTMLRVTGKSRFDFIPDGQSQNIKGAKVFVKDGQRIETDNKVGLFDTEFKIAYDLYDVFHTVPGIYEVDLALKVGSEGQFTIKGAEFVGDYDLDDIA